MTSIRPTHIIARRKGIRVRLFDVARAKMGPWVTDPHAVTARQNARFLADMHSLAQDSAKLPVIHNRATLEGMRVADIRLAYKNVFGCTFRGKLRKADMIDVYMSAQFRAIA